MAKTPEGPHDWQGRRVAGWECRRCGAVAVRNRDGELVYAKSGAELSPSIPPCRLTTDDILRRVRDRLGSRLEGRCDLIETIETKSGAKPGHIERWLAGKVELRVDSLLIALVELGENPREFFLELNRP